MATVDQLRRGARLHSLLFASYLAKSTERPYDVAWEGLRYRRAERDGTRGAISFSKLGVVALFYDPKSKEGPLELKKAYKLENQLKGMPPQFTQHLKRENVFDAMDVDVGGELKPVVTAAFWSERDGSLKGPKSWERSWRTAVTSSRPSHEESRELPTHRESLRTLASARRRREARFWRQ